jgi:hypothetical protein
MAVTIHAVSISDGTQSTITIDKTGPDTGTINVDGTNYNVYNVKAGADGKKLVCNTKRLFFTITVTVAVLASQSSNSATVSLTIAGAPFGNGTTDYSITLMDQTKLTQFIVGSDFPVLV